MNNEKSFNIPTMLKDVITNSFNIHNHCLKKLTKNLEDHFCGLLKYTLFSNEYNSAIIRSHPRFL